MMLHYITLLPQEFYAVKSPIVITESIPQNQKVAGLKKAYK